MISAPAPDPSGPGNPSPDDPSRTGTGTGTGRGSLAALGAYGLWGLFPLYFHALSSVAPVEVLAHRILWSFLLMVGVAAAGRDHSWIAPLMADRRRWARISAAGVLLSVNWLVYIWAVAQDRVLDASLGYFINPLVTVLLGVVLLGERLRPAQWAAVALGTAAVIVLTVGYGELPWVALVLAGTFGAYGYLKKTAGLRPVPSLLAETALLAPLAATGLVVAAVGGHLDFLRSDSATSVLLVMAGAVTAAPLLLFGVAAGRIPLSLLGLLQYVTPVVQFVLGVVVFHEALPPARWAGFALVWAALCLLSADALRAYSGGARRHVPTAPGRR